MAGALLGAAVIGGCANPRTPGEALSPAPARIVEEAATLTTPAGEIFGTLEFPAARLPVPVVLIIAGSGPTDRNGNSIALPGANNSLKMLADGLAARGIASLRYDKRGIGASRAAMTKEDDLRFEHFIDDATGWVNKLRQDPRFSTVTVAGHSEGSLIGMVAARTGRADAYVSLEGAGRKPPDVIAEQLSAQLPPAIVAQAMEAMKKIEAGEKPDSFPPMLMALFRPSVQPYLTSWFAVSPVEEIAKLDVPVRIVQGTTDLQVTGQDSKNLAAAKTNAKVVVIEGMNHVLKSASGPIGEQMKSYTDSTIVVVPGLIDEIAGFVKGLNRVKHSAFGIDKLKHFLFAGYVESVGFAGLQTAGAGRNVAFAGATAGTIAFSIGKEIHDRRTYGLFSLADLVWDALGVGAALLILVRTPQ